MTPIESILRERIARDGPVSVADYMDLALGHPEHGYYIRRDPLGAAGDFTTAPEITQIFGELIGLWSAVMWQATGSPTPVNLVELGPGRGTLMADFLRAARTVPAFVAAARVHLVETSPALRDRQAAALAGTPVTWHASFDTVPEGPLILVANEFFDALPIHQFQRGDDGWRERLIGLDDGGGLAFTLGPPVAPDLAPELHTAPPGAIVETCPAGAAIAAAIGRRIADYGGAALIIDYGPMQTAPGDSLQAVHRHAYHPVLAAPGEADLTAHVDFASLARSARPALATGPATQGDWLVRLGIETRYQMLAQLSPDKAQDILLACRRLIEPDKMGNLFKVLALHSAVTIPVPGF